MFKLITIVLFSVVLGLPLTSQADGKKIVVDPKTLTWAAYSANGDLVRSGRASLGKHYCADVKRPCRTVTGTFSIYRKGGASCKSSKYPLPNGGAKTPYCMHFHKGYALHGSNDVPNHNASHGCIRVPVSDARWLNQEFADYGTKIVVKPYGPAPKSTKSIKSNRSYNKSYSSYRTFY